MWAPFVSLWLALNLLLERRRERERENGGREGMEERLPRLHSNLSFIYI